MLQLPCGGDPDPPRFITVTESEGVTMGCVPGPSATAGAARGFDEGAPEGLAFVTTPKSKEDAPRWLIMEGAADWLRERIVSHPVPASEARELHLAWR